MAMTIEELREEIDAAVSDALADMDGEDVSQNDVWHEVAQSVLETSDAPGHVKAEVRRILFGVDEEEGEDWL